MADDDASAARQRFGETLFEMRRARSLTFTQMQESSGILISQLERWENGDDLPDPYVLITILRTLDPGPIQRRSTQALFNNARELTDIAEEREAFALLDRNEVSARGSADRSPSDRLVNEWLLTRDGDEDASRKKSGIFISYRRSDASAMAGRLYDRLAPRFGEDNIFLDVDTIGPGIDFQAAIDAAVGQAAVMLVIIGRGWLMAADAAGHTRLRNPDDLVRVEVEAALKRDIRIVPVLVDGASMPTPQELPRSLTPLAQLQAVRIDHPSFSGDVNTFVAQLGRLLNGPLK